MKYYRVFRHGMDEMWARNDSSLASWKKLVFEGLLMVTWATYYVVSKDYREEMRARADAQQSKTLRSG